MSVRGGRSGNVPLVRSRRPEVSPLTELLKVWSTVGVWPTPSARCRQTRWARFGRWVHLRIVRVGGAAAGIDDAFCTPLLARVITLGVVMRVVGVNVAVPGNPASLLIPRVVPLAMVRSALVKTGDGPRDGASDQRGLTIVRALSAIQWSRSAAGVDA